MREGFPWAPESLIRSMDIDTIIHTGKLSSRCGIALKQSCSYRHSRRILFTFDKRFSTVRTCMLSIQIQSQQRLRALRPIDSGGFTFVS